MEPRALMRVLDAPFSITGRGLVVVGEMVEGDLYLARTVSVTLAAGSSERTPVRHVAHVEAARMAEPPGERPAQLFPVDSGSEQEALLREMLRPGTVLTLAGPAVVVSPSPGRDSTGDIEARLNSARFSGRSRRTGGRSFGRRQVVAQSGDRLAAALRMA